MSETPRQMVKELVNGLVDRLNNRMVMVQRHTVGYHWDKQKQLAFVSGIVEDQQGNQKREDLLIFETSISAEYAARQLISRLV